MEKKKIPYPEITRRVDSVRRIYSRIGEPLPVDTLIDLYQHLGTALALLKTPEKSPKMKN